MKRRKKGGENKIEKNRKEKKKEIAEFAYRTEENKRS